VTEQPWRQIYLFDNSLQAQKDNGEQIRLMRQKGEGPGGGILKMQTKQGRLHARYHRVQYKMQPLRS